MVQKVAGSKSVPLDLEWLASELAAYPEVMLDLGAGNGIFVMDAAKAYPQRLVIGLDPVAENMAQNARRALAKKTRLKNALFLRGAAEELPGPLANAVDFLSVNYPWGSLLRIMSNPEPGPLQAIRATCRTAAEISILLNYTVFEDSDYLNRLDLAAAGDVATSTTFADAYRACGIRIEDRKIIRGDPPVRTGWGRQLVRGSDRKTLIIQASAI